MQLFSRTLRPCIFRPNVAFLSTATEIQLTRLRQACQVLGVDESASVDQVKEQFSKLARIYHPDTGGTTANASKFHEIRSSFKLILKSHDEFNVTEDVEDVANDIEQDINHTAPQHRQYLEYGGIGIGTPSQRQRQYQQYRVYNAVEKAADLVLDKALKEVEAGVHTKALQMRRESKYFSKKQKLTGMIDRVVEELILSSMGSGDFADLKGSGKPLKQDFSNPYIDQAEKRINDILKNSGFAPPWITQEAEIRVDIGEVRKQLREEYCRVVVLSKTEYSAKLIGQLSKRRYERIKNDVRARMLQLNRSILDYNLVSPIIGRQFVMLNFDKELEAAESFVDDKSGESDEMKLLVEDRIKKEMKSMNSESSFWQFLKSSF